jgi:hypothetical protein
VRALPFLPVLGLVAMLVACSGANPEPPASSSGSARADYDVFALRCSKCHSLARPLNSGIDDDDYWKAYVAKMRRQPGSGISSEDSVAILRFLHTYSVELRLRRGKTVEPQPAPPATAPASTGAPQ